MEMFQLLLNFGVQWGASAKSEHARMISENSTDKTTFDLAESLPTQLDHQFTNRQSALIL